MSTSETNATAGRRRGAAQAPVTANTETTTAPPPKASRPPPRPVMKRTLSSIHFGTIRGPIGKAQPQKSGIQDIFGSDEASEDKKSTSSGRSKASKRLSVKVSKEDVPTEATPDEPAVEEKQIETAGLTLLGKIGDTSVIPYNLGTLQESASIQQVDLMASVPRLPFLTKIAQIFQIAGLSDEEVWEGAPELFTVLAHFKTEIRASERYADTPIRVYLPKTPEFEGVECRDYQVDKTWPISKVIRIILKKLNIPAEEAGNFLLASARDHPLDSEYCLADYGLGSLFHSWQVKLTTKVENETIQTARKAVDMEAKKAALKRLKSSAESSSDKAHSRLKSSKRSSSKSYVRSSKIEKGEKGEKSKSSKSESPAKSSSKEKSSSDKTVDENAVSQKSSDPTKIPSLDLKVALDTGKTSDKVSPRPDSGRRKSNTGSIRIKGSKVVAAHPPEGGAGELEGDRTLSPTASPRTEKDAKSGDDKKSHSRGSSLQKKVSANSMTVEDSTTTAAKEEEDSKKSKVKKRSKGESSKESRPKKKTSSKHLVVQEKTQDSAPEVLYSETAREVTPEPQETELQSAGRILEALTMRPKIRSAPILLLLQQRELFQNDRVRSVKWNVTLTVKKLISAFLERQGQVSLAGQFVLCDLYGRVLHPHATLESYGLDAKLSKWELALVKREATEVSNLETQPLAAKYSWIKNKEVLPRIQIDEAKQIIIELDEKITEMESRDVVSQYQAKCSEVNELSSEIGVLKESEKALKQMFSALEQDKKLSIETVAEEMKLNKKIASEALKAFEESQTSKLALQRELEAERASRQSELKRVAANHATEIANLSDYSDALFAKNTELVSEMEELRNDMFEQRQKAKQIDREKQAAKAEVEDLALQLEEQKVEAELDRLQLVKQMEQLTHQLEQTKSRLLAASNAYVAATKASQLAAAAAATPVQSTGSDSTSHAHSVELEPISLTSDYTSTPTQRPDAEQDEEVEVEQVSEAPLVPGIVLKDGNVQIEIDLETIDESKQDTSALEATKDEKVDAVASVSDGPQVNQEPSEIAHAETSVNLGVQSTETEATKQEPSKTSPAPLQLPKAPSPPPAPPMIILTPKRRERPSSGMMKITITKVTEVPDSGASMFDDIAGMRSKLKSTPRREVPRPSPRDRMIQAIQMFSKETLRHTAPLKKQAQEPEGLAKALYKRFVAMTDMMDVEMLDDDEEDDWDTPSKSATTSSSLPSTASVSQSASNEYLEEEDEEDDEDFDQDDASDDGEDESDEDEETDSSYMSALSRASSVLTMDKEDDEEDSE